VAAATFDGTSFNITAKNSMPGATASWLLSRPGTSGNLYAVDENSKTTRLFSFAANRLSLVQNATGSSGVVFLEFNAARTRMVGAAFGQGQLDVWDVSAADGRMSLISQLVSNDTLGPNAARQASAHPHQVLLEPSGKFFVANDLGTDTVLVVDADADTPAIVNRVRIDPPGCGPRHGVFFPPIATSPARATHYILLCEILSLVQVFEVTYTDGGMDLTKIQSISTFGAAFPPANATSAAAGEVALSIDGQHVYISNRVTGNATDSIAHFAVNSPSADGKSSLELQFKDTVSSGGKVPRMFSLALGAERFIFCTNQDGALGLAAFSRNADGSLKPQPAASLPLSAFGASGFGPQFVQQI
jgi:6-phosphogluconolactonase (cycloisomerase 2 family)